MLHPDKVTNHPNRANWGSVMSLNLNYIILGAFVGLIAFIAMAHGVHAAECTDLIGCDSSNSNGGWSGDAKLDEIGSLRHPSLRRQA